MVDWWYCNCELGIFILVKAKKIVAVNGIQIGTNIIFERCNGSRWSSDLAPTFSFPCILYVNGVKSTIRESSVVKEPSYVPESVAGLKEPIDQQRRVD